MNIIGIPSDIVSKLEIIDTIKSPITRQKLRNSISNFYITLRKTNQKEMDEDLVNTVVNLKKYIDWCLSSTKNLVNWGIWLSRFIEFVTIRLERIQYRRMRWGGGEDNIHHARMLDTIVRFVEDVRDCRTHNLNKFNEDDSTIIEIIDITIMEAFGTHPDCPERFFADMIKLIEELRSKVFTLDGKPRLSPDRFEEVIVFEMTRMNIKLRNSVDYLGISQLA